MLIKNRKTLFADQTEINFHPFTYAITPNTIHLQNKLNFLPIKTHKEIWFKFK